MSTELPDWKNPTPAMLAAVAMSRRCAEKGGMNETLYAEWVISAPDSLWYLQAANWSENPPDLLTDEASREMFKTGAALVVRIVDLGYDEDRKMWWPLDRVWPHRNDAHMGILTLMDYGTMLDRMRNIPIWPKDVPREYAQPGFLLVSAGIWVFLSTVCGPRWRQRYAAMLEAAGLAKSIRFSKGRRGR